MKKRLLPLALLLVLASCTTPINSSTSVSEGEGNSVSEVVPSSNEDLPSSSETGPVLSDLSEIRATALAANWTPNSVGVYKSSIYVAFTAQLLTVQDYATSQSGYNTQYRVYVANSSGYMTVAISTPAYDGIKKYHDQQQVYNFKGYIGLYNDEVEVDMSGEGKPEYLKDVTLDYDYRIHAIPGGSISGLKDRVKAAKYNSKGLNWSNEIYTHRLTYVTKVENAVALFSDGTNMILVHSHDKLNNNFSVGNVYDLYGREGLYRFTPELEYIGHTTVTDTLDLDYTAAKSITASELSALKYELDKPSATAGNLRYTDALINLYYFEGYVNSYIKDYGEYIVFDDVAKAPYKTYQNARDGKALFANNKSAEDLYEPEDIDNCPFYDYLFVDENDGLPKIGFYFAAYSYNTLGYWQIQVLEDTIVTI